MTDRPAFIVSTAGVPEDDFDRYRDSDERLVACRSIGKAAGLQRIGLHIGRLPPGHRTSWPHAEELEEEFVYVLEGEVDAWVDGHLHRMVAGDLAAFPAGTGITHTFINNSRHEAVLLIGGEANKAANRIVYPLHPERKERIPPEQWWDDAPARELGPHPATAGQEPR